MAKTMISSSDALALAATAVVRVSHASFGRVTLALLVALTACGADRGAAVSPAALAALRAMQGATLPAALPERVFREVRALAGGLLEHHADLDPRARDVAFQVLAAG